MNKKALKDIQREIRQHHRAKRLLANEDFQEWYAEEIIKDAELYCVMVAENNLSNYDRSMSSGIIRFARRKFVELKTVGSADRLKKLQKQKGILNGRERKDREPGQEQLPYGTF